MAGRRWSYAEKINSAKMLAEGIGKHLEELSKLGLDNTLIRELNSQEKVVEDINVEQERLKAELKSKTEHLKKEMIKLDRVVNKARKLVKIEIPSSQWKEFGIEDKR